MGDPVGRLVITRSWRTWSHTHDKDDELIISAVGVHELVVKHIGTAPASPNRSPIGLRLEAFGDGIGLLIDHPVIIRAVRDCTDLDGVEALLLEQGGFSRSAYYEQGLARDEEHSTCPRCGQATHPSHRGKEPANAGPAE